MALRLLVVVILLLGASSCVQLRFEKVDAGFFFQQSSSTSLPHVSPTFPNAHSTFLSPDSGIKTSTLTRERLTVTRPSQSVKMQVSHGPFESKQTIPAQYVVPDSDFPSNLTRQTLDSTAHSLDITAHFVSLELRQENPVIRVLFHTGRHVHGPHDSEVGQEADYFEAEESASPPQLCVALHARGPNGGSPLTTTCSPQGVEGICLARMTLPYDWWPPVQPSAVLTTPSFSTQKPSKALKNSVELSYSVYETKHGLCRDHAIHPWHQPVKSRGHRKNHHHSGSSFPPPGSVLIQPQVSLPPARLVPNSYAYRDLLVNEGSQLRLVTPAVPLYSGSFFYVSVVVDSPSGAAAAYKEEPYAITVRLKVKSGLKIVSASPSNPAWSLNAEINGKHTTAFATVVRNFSIAVPQTGSQELFTWLLAVDVEEKESGDLVEGVRLLWAWTVRNHAPYRPDQPQHRDSLDDEKRKTTSRFEVLKDEVQSVLPVIKTKELVNTAMLTGRQVSEPLRVYMVSQGGKLADVTLQTTCSSADESILKVSSSCTSVYLDGSEVRGSKNATLVARYGNAVGTSSITVWVPEMPLDIQVDDVKLNLIAGWKITGERGQCKPRFQQTNFQVFAKFYAEDHDSGRVSYFLSRKTYIQVTDLVRKFIRLSDPRVALLKQAVVEGVKNGRTEIQVLSPMTGQVIGSREVRVTTEKVDVTHASVQVISGLSLTIKADPDLEFCYVAQVDITDRLTAKYQEAVLDSTLHFSDGTSLAVRQIDPHHFHVTSEARNSSVVTLTSSSSSPVPRVLALAEGKGTVTVTVEMPDSCRIEGQSHPLATTEVQVEVDFGQSAVTGVQNDARTGGVTQSYTLPHSEGGSLVQFVNESGLKRRQPVNSSTRGLSQGQLTFSKPGLSDLGEGQLSLKDDSNAHTRIGHTHVHGFSLSPTSHNAGHLTPLEIGMYVLLAVFCGAIFIFVGTCIVYATRARKGNSLDRDYSALPMTSTLRLEHVWNKWRRKADPSAGPESPDGSDPQETSDKNWVWLGRSTLDNPASQIRPSNTSSASQGQGRQCTDKDINRLSGISYSGSEVSVRILTHARPQDGGRVTYTAELCISDASQPLEADPVEADSDVEPPQPARVIDSSTYTKRDARSKSIGVTASLSASPTSPTSSNINEMPDLDNVRRRPKSNRIPYHLDENDTRRYARSWLLAGELVPRDLNRNSDDDNNSNWNLPTTDNGHCLATFVRRESPDIKRANIVENPRFSATLSDDDNNSILSLDNSNSDCNLAVDYERIMAYLGHLKESEA